MFDPHYQPEQNLDASLDRAETLIVEVDQAAEFFPLKRKIVRHLIRPLLTESQKTMNKTKLVLDHGRLRRAYRRLWWHRFTPWFHPWAVIYRGSNLLIRAATLLLWIFWLLVGLAALVLAFYLAYQLLLLVNNLISSTASPQTGAGP